MWRAIINQGEQPFAPTGNKNNLCQKEFAYSATSITEGHCDYEKGGWANRLKKHFENQDGDISVCNLGVSGDTTDDLLERFDAEAKANKPDMIIFAIGINDALRQTNERDESALERFKDNLRELLVRARAFADNVIFVGLTKAHKSENAPFFWNADIEGKNELIRKYDDAVKKMAVETDLPFIEMYDLLDREDMEDGLHPNSAGHEKMFRKIKDFLIENKII